MIGDSQIRRTISKDAFYKLGLKTFGDKDSIRNFNVQQYYGDYMVSAQVSADTGTGHVYFTIDGDDGEVMHHDCTCGRHTYRFGCEHVAATLFYLQSQYTLPGKSVEHLTNKDRRKIFEIKENEKNIRLQNNKVEHMLSFLNDEIENVIDLSGNTTSEKMQLHLYTQPKQYDDAILLSTKIGIDKEYKVKNIHQLLTNIYQEKTHKYGKNLTFKHSYDAFDDASKKIIDFFNTTQKIHEVNNYRECPELLIDQKNIDLFYELFQEMDKKYIDLNFMGKEMEIGLYVDEIQPGMYQIMANVPSYLYSEHAFYEYDEKTLYKSSIRNLDKFISILNEINSDLGLVFYDKTKLEKFLNQINLLFSNQVKIEGIKQDPIKMEEKLGIYADINDMKLTAKLVGTYDHQELNLMDPKYKLPTSIYANKIKNTLSTIMEMDEKMDNMFALDLEDDHINDLLEKGFPILQQYCDVFISESLKRFKDKKAHSISVGVKVESDLLKVDFSSLTIDKDEIASILRNFKRKKKFFKLKSGEVISLDNQELEKIDDFVDSFNGEVDENGELVLPLFEAFKVDEKIAQLANDSGKTDDNFKAFIDDFKQVKHNVIPIAKRFDSILKEYQKHGVNWLLQLHSYGFGGILADDMGLGKTIQTIAFLESVHKKKDTHLVICPASLMLNWYDEFKKFDSPLNVVCINGDADARKDVISDIKKYDVMITTYDYIRRDVSVYKKNKFKHIILDEAQYIKNHTTKSAHAIKKLNGEVRLALSGTPIENSLAELWSLFDFLMPGYLFNYNYFKKHYETPIIRQHNEKQQKFLKQMVEPFILRRRKEEVLSDLPAKEEQTLRFQFSENEEKLYIAKLSLINKELRDQLQDNNVNKLQILKMMTELRQICCEPRVLYENVSEVSSKMQGCLEVVESLKESGKKILLFSSFTTILDLLVTEFNKLGISYLKLTGSTKKSDRKELTQRFQDGEVDVFLISLKAGGVGLNLTTAQAVIHYDPWWNVSAQNQATDRAHRIGQDKEVNVYNLIMKDSLEEKIQLLQKQKKEIADQFVENSEGSISTMSTNDILDLLKRE